MSTSSAKARVDKLEKEQAANAPPEPLVIVLEDYRGEGVKPATQSKFTVGEGKGFLHRYRNKQGNWTEWSAELPPAGAIPPFVPRPEPKPKPPEPKPPKPKPPEPKTPDKQQREGRQSECKPVVDPTPPLTRHERKRLTLKVQAESSWKLNNERL